jgi:hypothetical protein
MTRHCGHAVTEIVLYIFLHTGSSTSGVRRAQKRKEDKPVHVG